MDEFHAKRLETTLQVVYQDDDYFIVNKPYDCRIQPDPRVPHQPSAETLIQKQYPHLPPLKNVHQIDYATSGIYVLALTRQAAAAVSTLFRERQVEKTYLAIVHGHLQQENSTFTIDKPIGQDPDHPFRMAVVPTGKSSFTTVHILQHGYYNDAQQKIDRIPVTKVLLYPKTGRRHQLRVHLQSIGHPILGDFNYEVPFSNAFRMMLHAYKIHFPLPSGPLTVETDDPFENFVI
ncbi:pseudouridine synthase [Halteromyces radiatus]|uniref:pseudouridine synthase n=1 Tax=Halteromyces radiatus TaxID=101107 RepID=UPI002220CF0C|nr:pseudouridine synthase [Halteromyces radiatus]KAI8079732.1 pseudouridine synthase [Halteromyces radiatus]